MTPPTQATVSPVHQASRLPDAVWTLDEPAEDRAPPSAEQRGSRAKRFLDGALAFVALVVSLPAWALLAAAVKLEDGGPVFFGQERVGKDGKTFKSWKFRSMRPRQTDETYASAELEEERITRVGRLMRATALDELPQLWNILRGDMSFVGPRALLPEEVVGSGHGETVRLEDVPGYGQRHSVRPGLTGLAQLHLPRDATHREKFRYDLLYVRSHSLSADVRLIARSVWISLRGRWPAVGKNGKEEAV